MSGGLLRTVRVPVVLVFATALPVVVVGARLHPIPFGLLAPLPPSVAVDYSPLRIDVSPLQAEFIRDVLGEPAQAQPAYERPPTLSIRSPRVPAPDAVTRIIDEHPLTNDRAEQARVIPRPPFTARTNTTNATRSAGEPANCGGVGGTVWYRYHSPITDGLLANTFGTSQSVTLGVYEGTPGRFRTVACDTDVQGNAVVAFPAAAGRDYYFQIGMPTGGPLAFSLDLQGKTTLESVSTSGAPGDNVSGGATISANGRIIVYGSLAKNIVPGLRHDPCLTTAPYVNNITHATAKLTHTTNSCIQLFARDLVTGKTSLVTAGPDGSPGNAHTARGGQSDNDRTQYGGASLSADGRYVAFQSEASNLVPGDTNGIGDAFVRDLRSGVTERVSLTWEGKQISDVRNGSVQWVSISADARYVVFESLSATLLPPGEDTNFSRDVFIRDRLKRTTTRVSVSSSGEQTPPLSDFSSNDNNTTVVNSFPLMPCISGDGRSIAFRSEAANLVNGDTNAMGDIFLHDMVTRTTERVSLSNSGEQANYHSSIWPGCLSHDGSLLVFTSRATNLVAGDTNNLPDVFVRDIRRGTTSRVNLTSSGQQSETGTQMPKANVAVISSNGRHVAFHSVSSDLVEGDQNTFSDVFIHDRITKTTSRVSTQPGGGEFTDSDAYNPSISADGRLVVFDAAKAGAYMRSVESVNPAQIYLHVRVPRQF